MTSNDEEDKQKNIFSYLCDLCGLCGKKMTDERRKSTRFDLDCSVSLWHGPTQRTYSGRSQNVSATGALLHFPLTIPFRPDDTVEVHFSNPKNEPTPKPFPATVVRINRGQSILQANQSVAIRFE
jgi:hypothetical protein